MPLNIRRPGGPGPGIPSPGQPVEENLLRGRGGLPQILERLRLAEGLPADAALPSPLVGGPTAWSQAGGLAHVTTPGDISSALAGGATIDQIAGLGAPAVAAGAPMALNPMAAPEVSPGGSPAAIFEGLAAPTILLGKEEPTGLFPAGIPLGEGWTLIDELLARGAPVQT